MMQTAPRLAVFALGLAAIGGSAAAIGSATDATPPFQNCMSVVAETDAMAGASMSGQAESGASMAPVVSGSDGSSSKLAGIKLDPRGRTMPANQPSTWRFRITDCNGDAVREFERDQTKLLHLIVVRSDLTGYQHLHPTLAADGTFAIAMTLRRPGRYRAIADFTTGGKRFVLGTNLAAPGVARSAPLPSPSTTATVDGYRVSLRRPAKLAAGSQARLTFRVTRAGKPVADLQPYLGAYGHLVALHAPDLEYSHVHPFTENLAAGAITFDAELPKSGPYRMFVQFRTGGRVHTAAFTQYAIAHETRQDQSS